MARVKKILISAATFSGNQGAASMLHATIQQLSAENEVEFSVFTVYPELDSKINPYPNVKVYSATPKRLVTALVPGSLVHRWLPFARKWTGKIEGIDTMFGSDLQIDLAGISFADGRRVFLIYNIASVLPAMIMGKPVIKFSQALGKFDDRLNKVVSKWFLPKFRHIFARGAQTSKSLNNLKLNNISDASDVAFLFKPSKADDDLANEFMKKHKLKSNEFIVFSPSRVLNKKAESIGIDYVAETAGAIDSIVDQSGLPVLILPHAIREPDKLHNNDMQVVAAIFSKLKHKNKVVYATNELYAGAIKSVISFSKLVVAARFHAMIGALSTGTPVVVTGWSHKYQEVLDSFDLEMPVVYLNKDYQKETITNTMAALKKTKQLSQQINTRLATIRNNAKKQVKYVQEILREAR